ncbi:MFS transporter [Muricomes sp. OA1]|uniref:MFS transporter n=1 Tax=Hungatella hathewayi TaxID=154046 RepID=A0A3E2WQN9_9FIRM|nr:MULTISPECIES: MFS transporter [Clostridia]MCH1971818.1 MFS transporter [Muricomes sp. OA1]RGC29403.1 MFS transporter [Hungatella hathewayi]GKH30617.1 MFS transporter [Faecalicatena contorta]
MGNSVDFKEDIKLREKLCYTSGNVAAVLVNTTLSSYLMYFYTDILGIAASAAAAIFLFSRIWDAFNDPLMGMVADRTRSRWGTYRPWILWVALPMTICGILCFTAPDFSYTGKLIWAWVTYIACGMCYTGIYIPYGVMNNVMTRDMNQRLTLATFRETGSDIASMIIGFTTMPLVLAIGHGNEAKGFQGTMTVYSLIGLACLVICFLGIRERRTPEISKLTLKESIGSLKGNKPALVIMLAMIVMNGIVMYEFSWFVYYIKYFLHRMDLQPIIMTMIPGVALICKFIINPIAQRVGKKPMLIVGSCIYLLDGILFLAAGSNLVLAIIACAGFGAGLTFFFVMVWGSVPDIVEYGEWKTGVRAPGFLYSMGTLSNKLGLGFSGLLAGWMLTVINYVPGAEQTAAVQHGIYLSTGIPLVVAGILCVILFLFYDLTQEKYNEILTELAERNAQK